MFFKQRKILIIFIAFGAYLCLEILLNSWLSKFMVDDNYIVEDWPIGFNRITIENLTAGIDKFKLLAKKPAEQNNVAGKENQNQEFHYQKIVCKNMLPIKGLYNYFRICYPIRWFLRFQPRQQIAYFINGRRDNEFERNFNKITDNVLLRVFTKQNVSIQYPYKPDSIGNFDVRIYTETGVDVNSNIPIIGIKDLIDARDDYHYMEFMKFEMKDSNARPFLPKKMNENCCEMNEPMRQLEICQTSEQQNEDIFVPNWLPDALGWIGRAELANSSLSYSCRLFKLLCWPKLHDNVKPYLVSILEFTESHNRAKLQRNGEEIPIAVSPPPNYILGFRRIYIFYYLDDQIVEFFKNVLHLLDNTQIQFAENFYSLEDRTSIHICWIRLLTLLSQSNIFSDLSILHYDDFKKFNELFPDMIDNFQSLSLGRLNGLDIIYNWLLKPRSDGKQKILHFDGYYYNLLCLNLKQEFAESKQSSKYCVYVMERYIEFKMENAQTGEILESFYKERDGGIPTYYLVRYPKGEEHWKEIREKNNCPFSAIYSNSINIGPNI